MNHIIFQLNLWRGNGWFERVSMLIILLNCITLGMYQPCSDNTHECNTNRCKILQGFDDFIFAFFWLEMTIKMVAMGVYGKGTYLADSWNRLDFFIVLSGALEYCLNVENMNLSAIRTIRVLRPLRAINRIPSMRILVMLLLDTLPMLGNVLLLCFFVFFIFGIVGVQLWQGILRQRCYLRPPDDFQYPPDLSRYYTFSQEQEYICTRGDNSGMHSCSDLPPYKHGKLICNGTAIPGSLNEPTNTSCVNWNQYYTECVGNGDNPFQGTISFDNIGLAWVAIFLVISLEGWTDIMYYVQDAHSFWDWIYFVLLIVIGSFFMINLCLVVIATQFSETKKREMERMRLERARFQSTSTLASSTNNSEPTTCYAEIVKYIAHLWRRGKRRVLKKYRLYKYERQQRREQKQIEAGIQPEQEISSTINIGHRKLMFHHPACPRMKNKQVSVTTQAIQQQQQQQQQPLQSISCTAVSGSTSSAGGAPTVVGGVGVASVGSGAGGGVAHHVETISSSTSHNNNNANNRTAVAAGGGGVGNATGSNNNVIGMQPMSSCSPHTAGPPPPSSTTNDIIVQATDAIENSITNRRPGLLRVPSTSTADSMLNDVTLQLLSPPSVAAARRRSSVMFSDIVLLHGGNGAVSAGGGSSPGSGSLPQNSVLNPGNITNSTAERNVCSSEKMTQTDPFPLQIKINPELCVSAYSTGDGNIWQISPTIPSATSGGHLNATTTPLQTTTGGTTEYCELNNGETMTCQELLALSGALSAALPTGQIALDSFFNSLTKGINTTQLPAASTRLKHIDGHHTSGTKMYLTSQQYPIIEEDFSCCQELYDWEYAKRERRAKRLHSLMCCCRAISKFLRCCKRYIKCLVEQKYFQQGILLAILINTLSMGIEYHNQPEMLTSIVETSNIVLSVLFAIEMLLKVIAEGPFGYISNGFNVFDGIIVVLSAVELCQSFLHGDRESSGLSVLRTFRLLRILKLVRFMPNLRRQLFVMLRTMDNVAVFFSLLILFIFIFSILGMNLFGCKFCERGTMAEGGECDRKNFDSLLWALVTVFQILTQEDWNMVLSNGMAKTSHWAALYFVALMTFGNYVLFNLLVAILVEGFSSERNERREREQRELAKSKLSQECYHSDPNDMSYDDSRSISESSDSFPHGIKNTWRSAEELRKIKDSNGHRDRYHRDHGQCHALHGRMGGCRSFLQRECSEESKCNIQKESKMLQQPIKMAEYRAPSPQPPIITHTAATPQDSPNTTLEPGASFKEFYFNSSFIDSLDSIDKSSCNSIPGLLKPPALNGRSTSLTPPTLGLLPTKQLLYDKLPEKATQESNITPKLITHNEKNGSRTTTFSEKVYCPAAQNAQNNSNEKNIEKPTTEKPMEKNDKCKIQRGYSWKISRPSLRKKNSAQKNRSGSDSDAVLVLNNGRNHSQGVSSVSRQASLKNSDNAIRIQNDTQGDTPNNKSSKGISPQNSIRSKCSTYSSIPQVAWQQSVNRQNSLTSNNSSQPPKICPYNTIYQYQEQRLSLTPESNEAKTINNLNDKVIDCSLTKVNKQEDSNNEHTNSNEDNRESNPLKKLFSFLEPTGILKEREEFSLYMFPSDCRVRVVCTWLVEQKWFDNVVLMFIALNCITLAMERPNIPPNSAERHFLSTANYVFTVVFAIEMFIKVVATGMCYGPDAYFTSGWNIMDGSLVIISIIDLLMSIISESSPRIFGILRVFRLLRSLRPLRVINRAPGLKLVVQTLLSSLRPIGNIVLICCTFFIIFGILGVQLFKGTFYYCKGDITKDVRNKTDCTSQGFEWTNQKYNFDDLGKALMSLFVLSSRDGWVNIMYTGLDAVGVDQQPIVNYSEWRLLYFISFILLVGFFVLNMFVGVVVENFHRCREEQEKEERVRRAAKRALQLEKRRRRMNEPPYYTNYSRWRLFIHNVCTSKYFDLAIAAVIGLNVVTMAMECYKMPDALEYALKIFNYFFTAVFILESLMKLLALGLLLYLKDKWNQLDVFIVVLSVVGIVLEELRSKIIPINPTVLRVMRVLRIARVLKLLKMAKGIRALLDTVMQALPQVGNLGLLFFLLFFIFAALGVELFGRLECSDENPCQGLGEHAHFSNFGMAFLTLFRVATGDNWNGIMKDTLRDNCNEATDCVKNCCVSSIIAPIFFVIFVLMAQFVLVNVVVAVLMKHLEESHKHLEDETDMDLQLEREMQEQQEEQEERELCLALQMEVESRGNIPLKKTLTKVLSLPSNFTYNPPGGSTKISKNRRQSMHAPPQQYTTKRRQTFHSQQALLPNIISGRSINYHNNKYENNDYNFNDDIIYEKSVHVDPKLHEQPNTIEEDTDMSDKIEDDTLNNTSMPTVSKNNELSTIISESMEDDQDIAKFGERTLLSVPCVQKQVHKMFGSTKHLFKQKAIDDDGTQESFLMPVEYDAKKRTSDSLLPTAKLSIPTVSKKASSDSVLLCAPDNRKQFDTEPDDPILTESPKIEATEDCARSEEDIQKIISERRQQDETMKEVLHFDIFESPTDIDTNASSVVQTTETSNSNNNSSISQGNAEDTQTPQVDVNLSSNNENVSELEHNLGDKYYHDEAHHC